MVCSIGFVNATHFAVSHVIIFFARHVLLHDWIVVFWEFGGRNGLGTGGAKPANQKENEGDCQWIRDCTSECVAILLDRMCCEQDRMWSKQEKWSLVRHVNVDVLYRYDDCDVLHLSLSCSLSINFSSSLNRSTDTQIEDKETGPGRFEQGESSKSWKSKS